MKPVLLSLYMLCLTLAGLHATPLEDFLTNLRESRLQDAMYYLQEGRSVDTAIYKGEPVLIIICREQRERELRWLLEQGATPDTFSSQGESALYLAAKLGNRNMVQTLLQWGADINLRISGGETPLLGAVNGMHHELASWMEGRGALIKGNGFASPLLDEVWKRRQHCAQALALRETRWKHFDFLHAVVHENYKEILSLLDKGANPRAADTEYVSALMMSASRGNSYIGNLLLNRGAHPLKKDALGLSALWYASYFGNLSLMESLIKSPPKGEAPMEVPALEDSPLFAAWSSRSYTAMQKILDYGLKSGPGRRGAQLLHYAAFSADLRTIRMLFKAGCSLNVKDQEGRNAMDYLILGFELSGNEPAYLEEAQFLKNKGIFPKVSHTVKNSPALSKLIFSPWD